MRVTQTISIGTLRINSMSNSSIVQIGTSGAVKTRSEEITEVIPQQEANQKLEDKIYKTVKPKMKKEGIPTVQQPSNEKETGGKTPDTQPGAGFKPITGNGSGGAHGDIGTEGSPNGQVKNNAGGSGGAASSGIGNGGGNGNGVANGSGSQKDVTTDSADRRKTRT